MKKVILSLMIGILLISLFSFGVVIAQANGQENEKGQEGIGTALKVLDRLKEKTEENIENEAGDKINLRLMENNRIRLRVKNVSADCDCELEQEQVQNKTKLKAKLSNGRYAEIKIMPDTASERALERLRLKVCSEENNCSIELKEVGKGNETKLAYEVQAERHAKILWLFRKKMQVKAQVDAETGEIIRVKKPWWAFLASEPDETEE